MMEQTQQQQQTGQTTTKKRVVVVRRNETSKQTEGGEPALQLPKITSPRTTTPPQQQTKPKKSVIVERKSKPGENLSPLTPHSEAMPSPPKATAKGPIVDNHGDIVQWSVLGDPEDFRQMMTSQNTQPQASKPPQQLQQSQQLGATNRQATKSAPLTKPTTTSTQEPPSQQLRQQTKKKSVTQDDFGASVPAYEQAQLARQVKALERMEQVQDTWQRIEENIAEKIGKDAGSLAMRQAENLARTRQEYEIVRTAVDVASGKAIKPLFEEPFRPGKSSQLVGKHREVKAEPLERFGKPGKARPNPPTSTYFLERREQLRDQLESVDPFEPEIEHLFVRGISVVNMSSNSSGFGSGGVLRAPRGFLCEYEETVSSYTPDGEGISDSYASFPETPQTPQTVVSYYPCSEDTHYSTTVNVDDAEFRTRLGKAGPALELSDDRIALSGVVGELVSGVVTAHNSGTTAISFSWKRTKQQQLLLQGTKEKQSDGKFYFNDLSGVILPGEHRLFTFVFKTRESGIFFDGWELFTIPQVGSVPIIVNIKAVALPKGPSIPATILQESSSVDSKIIQRGAKRAMQSIFDECIGKALKIHEQHKHKQQPEIETASKFVRANRQYGACYSLEATRLFEQLANETNCGEKWKSEMSISAIEECISRNSNKRNLRERFEELLVRASTEEHGRERPRLVSVCRLLLSGKVSQLQGIEESIPVTPGNNEGLAFKEQPQNQGTSRQQQKRTLASYLERIATEKKRENARVMSAAPSNVQTATNEQTTNPTTQREEEQTSSTTPQIDRRRRRGVAATTTTSTTKTQTSQPKEGNETQKANVPIVPPVAATISTTPSIPVSTPKPQTEIKQRRRRSTQQQQSQESLETTQPQPQTTEGTTGTSETTTTATTQLQPDKQMENDPDRESRELANARKQKVVQMFRSCIVALIDDFTKMAGPVLSQIIPETAQSQSPLLPKQMQSSPPQQQQGGVAKQDEQQQQQLGNLSVGASNTTSMTNSSQQQRRRRRGDKDK